MRAYIFSGKSATEITEAALENYFGVQGLEKILIVCPDEVYGYWSRHSKYKDLIAVKHDSSAQDYFKIRDWLVAESENFSFNKGRWGWYLQQFIKLSAVWNESKPCLVLDGDTIFSRRFLSNLVAKPSLLRTRENPKKYVEGAKLIGVECLDQSYIANGGVFDPASFKKMGSNCSDWFLSALKVILIESCHSDFSEYQINGGLRESELPIQTVKIFRRGDLLCGSRTTTEIRRISCSLFARGYDAVAFEFSHKTNSINRLLARAAAWSGYSW